MSKILILLFLLGSLTSLAKEYQVKLHIKNLPQNAQPILLGMYNGNMFVIDSLPHRQQNVLTFRIPANTNPGMLKGIWGMTHSSMAPARPVATDFLFNRENIELNLDYNDPQNSIEVIQSDENRIYFDFLKTDALFFKKLAVLEQVVVSYPGQDEFYQNALDHYRKTQSDRDKFIDKTYKSQAKTLAGKIIKNQKLPITNDKLTPEIRDSIFSVQFLSQVDFNDTTLLYTNVYTDKIFRYIQMARKPTATPRENEANCIRALDYIVPLLDVNPTIQQHLLQFLIAGFESMNMEEALAHISSNYLQQCGSSSDVIKRRLEGYRKMAVGQKVPDFTLTDIQDNPVNLYNNINLYTLIIFWHTSCGHCQILLDELPLLSQKGLFSQKEVKIIGISIDENKNAWQEYSAKHSFEWTNAWTPGNFESPVAADYNLFATPTMFLIDADYKIIAKPMTLAELEKNIMELK